MSTVSTSHGPQPLLHALHTTLKLNQKRLAELLGVSARTVSRRYRGGLILLPAKAERLARACHPHDRVLAADLARLAGKTLVDLGLEGAPGPGRLALPREAHPFVVDAVVSVAAEAMQVSPHAMRPAVRAAFERAAAVGMTVDDVLAALASPHLPAEAGTKPERDDREARRPAGR